MIALKFLKMKDTAKLPSFGGDDNRNAGIDFCAAERVVIYPKESRAVGLGVAWEVCKQPGDMKKYAMIIQSRSGLAFNKMIEASNAGVIDEHYRGEIKVRLYNNGDDPFVVEVGDRVCQGIVHVLPEIYKIEMASELSETNRGSKGFGSSGIK
jgi:dUTP pyrophosphatase